jgi:iron complex outermembrane receptor protein
LQRNSLHARDTYDPTAPAGFPVPQGTPLDNAETQYAYHFGIEHRLNPALAVFARTARSFRVPNADERIGSGPLGGVTNFALRTQTSHDYEAGARVHMGPFDLQSSVYGMDLVDEIHFNPFTFANVNLDPTRRYGVETALTYRMTPDVTWKASGAYIRSVFRSGPFAGNDVPEVPRWAGSASVAWNIYQKYLTFDGVVRFAGKRYMDGDENNSTAIMMVPSYAVVDARLGGEINKFFWSVSVQNLFNRLYFDYGLNNSFPGNQSLSIYPLPGRTVMLRAGASF